MYLERWKAEAVNLNLDDKAELDKAFESLRVAVEKDRLDAEINIEITTKKIIRLRYLHMVVVGGILTGYFLWIIYILVR